MSERDIRATLLAALLHDAGHVPFSHYLEECRPLFSRCEHETWLQALLRHQFLLFKATDAALPEAHEELRKLISQYWLEPNDTQLSDGDPLRAADSLMELIASILLGRSVKGGVAPTSHGVDGVLGILCDRDSAASAKFSLLRSIMDGPIDADKLDYVRRDAHHAELAYPAGADTSRFLNSLTVALNPPAESGDPPSATIAVTEKGTAPVESLLLSRYQVFSALYWHHTCRSATSVFQYLVWLFLIPPADEQKAQLEDVYLGPSQDHQKGARRRGELLAAFYRRRDELFQFFRKSDDDSSLGWLVNRVREDCHGGRHEGIVSETEIEHLGDGLTRRAGLPVVILDVSYAHFVETGGKYGRSHLESLGKVLAEHDKLNSQTSDVFSYSLRRRKILQRFASYITSTIENETGQRLDTLLPKAGPGRLHEGNLFIDIPLGSKDQVESLWVLRPRLVMPIRSDRTQRVLDVGLKPGASEATDRAASGEGSPIDMTVVSGFRAVSPMAEAIQGAFAYWARRVRVFTPRAVKSSLLSVLDERRLSEIAFDGLLHAYELVVSSAPMLRENDAG